MPDDRHGERCVQTRRGPDRPPDSSMGTGIETFLATCTEPEQVRFTHGRSEYIDRFRDLDSSPRPT